jgi:hypothetical protein
MTLKKLNYAYDQRVKVYEKQVLYTVLTDTDQQQAVDFDAAIPAADTGPILFVGAAVEVTTPLSDGGVGTFTCDVGIKDGDTDAFLDAADLSTAAGDINVPKGAVQSGIIGNITGTIIVDGSVNLNTLTAGDFTVKIFYINAAWADTGV